MLERNHSKEDEKDVINVEVLIIPYYLRYDKANRCLAITSSTSYRGGNIVDSFMPKNFGDMGTEITFLFKKFKKIA